MTIDSIAKNQMGDSMMKLASMKRINSASDDAAGLAIMEKMESQIKGLDKGTDNTRDMQNLVKTAEGALNGIDDSLQRIRELSVQASNGTYNDSDRALIQQEVSQLIEGIGETAKGAQFNAKNVLDGSFVNQNTASSPNGTGASVSISDMQALYEGLKGYDVSSGSFDIGRIDNSLETVTSARSTLGALSNRFDHTVNANNIASLNMADAKSRIADMDMAKGLIGMNRDRVLNEAQIYNQRRNMDQMNRANPLSMLL